MNLMRDDLLELLEYYQKIVDEQADMIKDLVDITKKQAERLKNYEQLDEIERS